MAHELPKLPASRMQEANPYLGLPAGDRYGDPYMGQEVLHWYSADQMRAYAAAHAASLEAEVARLRYALQDIADMTYDKWTNGARAGDIAIQVLSHPGARDG